MAQHFPFNPARVRRGFLACALLAAAAMGLAVRSAALRREGFPAYVRGGLCAGLAFASGWMAWRLRPRAGWGVTLDAQGLTLGRREGADPLMVPWSQVEFARAVGQRRSEIAVLWGAGRRLLLTERLFAGRAEFQALTRALEAHVPLPAYDA